MKQNTEPPPPRQDKPGISLFFATGFGLGYIPLGPGTWGSLLGVGLAWASGNFFFLIPSIFFGSRGVGIGINLPNVVTAAFFFLAPLFVTTFAVSFVGVFVAGRVANYMGSQDPQIVVIDEISGQLLTCFLFVVATAAKAATPLNQMTFLLKFGQAFNWKYLLTGFILFRIFDIWKPFPVRQAESLPGGWGIMADDWLAAVYAALGLWLLRWLGL